MNKALMDSFISIMGSEAWKALETWSKAERESSIKRTDAKSARELTLSEICEERGIRKGIEKIFRYAEDCKSGI